MHKIVKKNKNKWCALLVSGLLTFEAHATQILVPAYFYPSSDPAQSFWDEMTAAASHVSITAIMNPDNGPGNSVNADYTSAINTFRAAGGKVLGYVPTGYGGRKSIEILDDVAKYTSFYSVDGIFLDEMSNDPRAAFVEYYQNLHDTIKHSNPTYSIFSNPGATAPEEYVTTADTIVTFENQSGYANDTPDAWTQKYSADHFAHLLYNVGSQADMQANVAIAASRNVGFFYVTDDVLTNPWDTLPGYWNAEVSSISAVPVPASGVLLLSGLALLGAQQRKRRQDVDG